MFGTQIDGIDHHVKAWDGRGGICYGWHRHEWDAVKRTCRDFRKALPNFDPGDSIELFVLRCCDVLGIHFAEDDSDDLRL